MRFLFSLSNRIGFADTVRPWRRSDPRRAASTEIDHMVSTAVQSERARSERYLTNDEAAEFLRLSPRTLEKQRVLGGGPRFRKFGRRVLYAIADLEQWAESRTFEMTSDPGYASSRR